MGCGCSVEIQGFSFSQNYSSHLYKFYLGVIGPKTFATHVQYWIIFLKKQLNTQVFSCNALLGSFNLLLGCSVTSDDVPSLISSTAVLRFLCQQHEQNNKSKDFTEKRRKEMTYLAYSQSTLPL